MLKIFVSGDNHFGLKYTTNHPNKEKIISERLIAFDNAVAKANDENCGLLAITGDLFNSPSVPVTTIKQVVDILKKFKGDIVVLPGNHDYYSLDSKLWNTFEKYADNEIYLLKEEKPLELDIDDKKVVIYPAYCDKKNSDNSNRLDWIKNTEIKDDGKIHIGIAHGAVEGESLDKEGKYFPMTREELNSIPVDLWLIGHTHVPFPNDLSEEFTLKNQKIFNAGTHSQTDFSNNTEGCCFIIEIDDDKKIRAKKFVSGSLRFYRKEIKVKADEFEKNITDELSKYTDNSVVELNISGAVSGEEYDNREEILENATKRFVEKSFHFNNLTKQITEDLIKREFADITFPAKVLMELIDNPKEAQLFYDLLKETKEGKK